MDMKFTFRDMVKYRAGALCLIGILASTYLHSTTFMSQFFYNSIILGGIAAFAIDAGVVAMSIFKDELLKNGQLAWMVRVVTVCVLFASGVANMSEGFVSAYGTRLTMESMMALDILTMIQWFAGTIIFPILAYVMCDTIGTKNLIEYKQQTQTREAAAAATAKASKQRQRRPKAIRQKTPAPQPLEAANQSIQKNKRERVKMLEDYIDRYPDATLSEMADAVGVSSRETVRKYLQEIGQTTPFSRN